MAKKRHHYVPKAYLQLFCREGGKLHVYLKASLPLRLPG
jgi:hypothetical protein